MMGSNAKKFLLFLMFVVCFILAPAILLVSGIVYLRAQEEENLLKQHQEELNRVFKNLHAYSDGERFWCQYLNHELDNRLLDKQLQVTIGNISGAIDSLRKDLQFDYVLFEPKKGVVESTVPTEPLQDWVTALTTFHKRLRLKKRDLRDPLRHEEEAIGRVFGPQVCLKHLENSTEERYFLVWPDSTFVRPLLWVKVIDQVLVVVMIKRENLQVLGGVKSFLRKFSQSHAQKLRFAVVEGNEIDLLAKDTRFLQEIVSALELHDTSRAAKIETENLIVFPRFIRPGLSIVGYFDQSLIKPDFHNVFIVVIFLFLLVSLVSLRYALNVYLKGLPDALSLKWKLRYLFFFANGLPLMVLFFIGTDYLNQKRDTLLQETMARGIAFLQSFDESFESEYARILVNKRLAEEKLMRRLEHEELNQENLEEFAGQIGNYEYKFMLVASRSEAIGTEKGLYDPRRGLLPEGYRDRSESNKSQLDFVRKIGHYFVDSINGTKISDKIATEIEILVESVTQKPVVNFVFDMMQKRGNFTQWGFGANVHPAIIDTFTLGHTRTEDYFFLAIFRKQKFQHAFMEKVLPTINRNNIGLKVVALKDHAYSVPAKAYDNEDLRAFASTLTSFPGDEIKIVRYLDEEHLVMGFKANSLSEYSLVGLYPVARIDSLIVRQKRQLSIFAVLSLLVTLALSQILAHSFIVPLGHLSVGAKAIEDKHFSHRLPEMGLDEFGKMGEIFNNVMVDLDELSVASAIQEQLLPQGEIATGQYSLFGRSVSMGELGGDYYDFIQLEDGHFSVMLGDVAGHGVGAALIMAMAKAGIIQSDHLLNQPLALISRLHNLVYSSKTKKQKKIMTFQYLYIDSHSGNCTYSNAGACSPMIIRKSRNQVEELKVGGAALGAFKKANFSEVSVTFEPGDAIIFYTDGIVEARNDAGEEMGYDALKTLLLRSWDINAEVFYQNIFNGYLNHLQSQSAQDDLTMIILVFTGSEKESGNNSLGMQVTENAG